MLMFSTKGWIFCPSFIFIKFINGWYCFLFIFCFFVSFQKFQLAIGFFEQNFVLFAMKQAKGNFF